MIFSLLRKTALPVNGYNIQNSQNMDKQKIHYCFTLSDVQMEYLRCKKYKTLIPQHFDLTLFIST